MINRSENSYKSVNMNERSYEPSRAGLKNKQFDENSRDGTPKIEPFKRNSKRRDEIPILSPVSFSNDL